MRVLNGVNWLRIVCSVRPFSIQNLSAGLQGRHLERKYFILIDIGIPMKIVRLPKMCLHKTHNKVHMNKYLSDNFYI